MTKARTTIKFSAPCVIISLGVLGWTLLAGNLSVGAQNAKFAAAAPHPVDDDMHHFMEYVFEPTYVRLQAGMAEPPKDKEAWKTVKSDALILAECANLLLLRVPDEDAQQWRQRSVAVRTHGGELYQAARKSDYPSARKAYHDMLDNCNTCHTQFADGEHQLKP